MYVRMRMRGKYERGGAQHDPQGALHDPSLHDCGTATYTGHGNVSNYRRDVTTMTCQLVCLQLVLRTFIPAA